MDILLVTVAAAVLGALGPRMIALLPEPAEPAADKPRYDDIARLPGLGVVLAVVAAAMSAAVAAAIDEPAMLPAWVVVCGVGAWLGYIDIRTRLLPFRMTAPLHGAVLVLVLGAAIVARDGHIATAGLLAMVAAFAVFWVIYALGRLFRGGAFGYGDVRLAPILGLALGPLGFVETTVGLYAGFVLGVLLALPLMLFGGRANRHFAFGPFMVAGAVVGVWWPVLVG